MKRRRPCRYDYHIVASELQSRAYTQTQSIGTAPEASAAFGSQGICRDFQYKAKRCNDFRGGDARAAATEHRRYPLRGVSGRRKGGGCSGGDYGDGAGGGAGDAGGIGGGINSSTCLCMKEEQVSTGGLQEERAARGQTHETAGGGSAV